MDETAGWVIDRIRKHRFSDDEDKLELLVEWEDYSREFDSWEPYANIAPAKDRLKEYLDRIGGKASKQIRAFQRMVARAAREAKQTEKGIQPELGEKTSRATRNKKTEDSPSTSAGLANSGVLSRPLRESRNKINKFDFEYDYSSDESSTSSGVWKAEDFPLVSDEGRSFANKPRTPSKNSDAKGPKTDVTLAEKEALATPAAKNDEREENATEINKIENQEEPEIQDKIAASIEAVLSGMTEQVKAEKKKRVRRNVPKKDKTTTTSTTVAVQTVHSAIAIVEGWKKEKRTERRDNGTPPISVGHTVMSNALETQIVPSILAPVNNDTGCSSNLAVRRGRRPAESDEDEEVDIEGIDDVSPAEETSEVLKERSVVSPTRVESTDENMEEEPAATIVMLQESAVKKIGASGDTTGLKDAEKGSETVRLPSKAMNPDEETSGSPTHVFLVPDLPPHRIVKVAEKREKMMSLTEGMEDYNDEMEEENTEKRTDDNKGEEQMDKLNHNDDGFEAFLAEEQLSPVPPPSAHSLLAGAAVDYENRSACSASSSAPLSSTVIIVAPAGVTTSTKKRADATRSSSTSSFNGTPSGSLPPLAGLHPSPAARATQILRRSSPAGVSSSTLSATRCETSSSLVPSSSTAADAPRSAATLRMISSYAKPAQNATAAIDRPSCSSHTENNAIDTGSTGRSEENPTSTREEQLEAKLIACQRKARTDRDGFDDVQHQYEKKEKELVEKAKKLREMNDLLAAGNKSIRTERDELKEENIELRNSKIAVEDQLREEKATIVELKRSIAEFTRLREEEDRKNKEESDSKDRYIASLLAHINREAPQWKDFCPSTSRRGHVEEDATKIVQPPASSYSDGLEDEDMQSNAMNGGQEPAPVNGGEPLIKRARLEEK